MDKMARSFFALTVSLVWPLCATAASLGPAKPSQLGTIFSAASAPTSCGSGTNFGELRTLLLPDETATGFSIPAGEVFILTRLDVSLASSGSFSANVNLRGVNTSTASASNFAFQLLTVSGPTTIHFDFPSGMVVKPGTQLYLSSGNTFVSVGDSYGYGYFAKDK
jgi:hypothetical protein